MTDSANLDVVRSIFEEWERGNFGSAQWAHPEIEYVMPDGPDPGSWTGLPAMAEAVRARLRAWDDLRFVPDEYRELDEERILVLFHSIGRGTTSGLDLGGMQTRSANLFHFRDGKVTRLVNYFDRERALADLGLGPEADSP